MTSPAPPDEPAKTAAPAAFDRVREAPPPVIADRYEDLGLLARGGMGEVRRVRDRVLDRVVVMKLLHDGLAADPGARERFAAEARATAGLQHPGIVAVHDFGLLDDGRPWFVMREVSGRTLSEVIADLHGREAVGWTLRRTVDAFARVCAAVAYAHDRGVLHRDLKPDNVMVGPFGEVLVLDWGLARGSGTGEPAAATSPDTPPGKPDSEPTPSRLTAAGAVMGTAGYMAPEQARGETVSARADVFSLGATLFTILTGAPPHGDLHRIRHALEAHDLAALPAARPDQPPVPDELAEICAQALAPAPSERPPDAAALAGQLTAWLDGARRRDRALAAVARADRVLPEVQRMRAEAKDLDREASAALASLPARAPSRDKQAAWTLEDRARALRSEAAVREVEHLQALHSALHLVADLPEARARLADHHRDGLERAEARADADATAHHAALLATYDDGRHAAWLRGATELTVLTDPPGAEATLLRFAEVGRRLEPVEGRALGSTPLVGVPLPRGSWLVRIRAPGAHDVDYPVFVPRGRPWSTAGPGEAEAAPIWLPPIGALQPTEAYVPAGWCVHGGDPEAPDATPRRWVWVDSFVIRRHPVTHGEYLQYVNTLMGEGQAAAAAAAVPTREFGTAEAGSALLYRRVRDRYELGADPRGARYLPNFPVTHVDWHQARAFAAWERARTGLPWRLPHDREWEKAARGVDGRSFPWGEHFEPEWAATLAGQQGEPGPLPVGSHPSDLSVYGVFGMTGGARDWCNNAWTRDGEGADRVDPHQDPAGDAHRVVRGGSWNSVAAFCRLAARFGIRPSGRFAAGGFRLVRSLPG